MTSLSDILSNQWRELRQLTYDYIDMLEPEQLSLTLPFPESTPIVQQFWCMLGAQESYTKVLIHGTWQGFNSSLRQLDTATPSEVKAKMVAADQVLLDQIATMDLAESLENGKYGYEIVQRIIAHEGLHHGQLINLMFCHHLPIPQSWQDEWALSYGD